MLIPSTAGRGLVNLVAELEHRLTGSSLAERLDADLAAAIPSGDTIVLALFDGLGAAQARREPALAASTRGTLHAPFPTTTTVSLATVATGRTAAGHGVLGHLMWLPGPGVVANVLKFVTPEGRHLQIDTRDFLPAPNLWERLAAAAIEPITVQPGNFEATPLSKALYRGCRFEPVWSTREFVDATVELAARPGRLIFAYWPSVDVAAHVFGQRSAQYRREVDDVIRIWDALRSRLMVPLVGTADHGHLDYRDQDKVLLRSPGMSRLTWYGDPRAVLARGDAEEAAELLGGTGARLVDGATVRDWYGHDADPHPQLGERLPDVAALAPPGAILLPKGFDRRLVGYHGGLLAAEVEIPLLLAGPDQRAT